MRVGPALTLEFPGLRIFELELSGLSVRPLDPEVEAWKAQIYAEVRSAGRTLESIKDEPVLRAYRDFYWKVGVDPTKMRPAAEAIARRVLGGRDIPTINTLVDVYNTISLKTSVAIAAFDLAQLHRTSLRLRRAQPAEEFLGIGMDRPISLRGGEIVAEDAYDHQLVAVYPYRNAERSKVTVSTTSVLLWMCGVPGIADSDLERARDLCRELISRFSRRSAD